MLLTSVGRIGVAKIRYAWISLHSAAATGVIITMTKVIYSIMLFLLLACNYEPSKSEIKQAHQLIEKIDSYILLNGKSPYNQDA